MRHRLSARLASWQIWLLSLAGGLLWLSGVAWLVLYYFGRSDGDLGPRTNPAEVWMLRLHGLVLLPGLLALGGLMVSHIPLGWVQRRQRMLGVLLSSVLAVLIVSGYLLYYLGDEGLRADASVIHWAFGLALPACFFLHYIRGLHLRRGP